MVSWSFHIGLWRHLCPVMHKERWYWVQDSWLLISICHSINAKQMRVSKVRVATLDYEGTKATSYLIVFLKMVLKILVILYCTSLSKKKDWNSLKQLQGYLKRKWRILFVAQIWFSCAIHLIHERHEMHKDTHYKVEVEIESTCLFLPWI